MKRAGRRVARGRTNHRRLLQNGRGDIQRSSREDQHGWWSPGRHAPGEGSREESGRGGGAARKSTRLGSGESDPTPKGWQRKFGGTTPSAGPWLPRTTIGAPNRNGVLARARLVRVLVPRCGCGWLIFLAV